MPLVNYSIAVVRDLVVRLRQQGRQNINVLTLSHPDLVIHPDQLAKLMKGVLFDNSKLKIRADSEATIRWHKAQHRIQEVVDTASFFTALGCRFTAVDMVEGRGDEILHNLNEPWPASFLNGRGFDIVFDCITNQCFNVAQAMKNAWEATAVGGYCFHVTPVAMVNQGFWNVSPTAYHDFYAANCGEIIRFEHIVGVYDKSDETVLDKTRRCRGVMDDTMNVVVARKLRDASVTWPIMTKFQLHPTCQK